MDDLEKYEIWKTNPFNEHILSECVGIMYSKKLAKDFVAYQASLGESYTVLKDGKEVELFF